jgi:glycosyltransferase involved in cell wall biosynthesis
VGTGRTLAAVQVSVVVPCYNSLTYLPETLRSILDQRLPASVDELEVVLVDDGGDDELAAWAARLGDARVRVVRQDNAGVSAARNRGIAASHGEVVAFCDSDDVWVPTTVADLVACFERDPGIGLAYGWYDVVDADGQPTGAVRRSDWEGSIWEHLVTDNVIGASGVMVARAAFDDVGVFAENRDRFRIDVEDWELWLRIAARWRVGLARSVVYHYRRHGSNSSSDVESLSAAYAHLFDVVFADVSPSRAALRPLAEARADVILAWQSLNDRQDPSAALVFLDRAARRWPPVRRGAEYWRLRCAATVLRTTGPRGYDLLHSANAAARRARAAAGR